MEQKKLLAWSFYSAEKKKQATHVGISVLHQMQGERNQSKSQTLCKEGANQPWGCGESKGMGIYI